ncbi:hypothetical protein [Hymenobacter cavernae]|uniref:Uncharacterized protein n=1 Tax=Hymenobacter cavernae TaxID=2044852 RepID=A0ABQ1TLI7_9BACT|nr:hypothetical protein [Hymenobacter cavernae]GGE97243.1 hypothetical protein GCM10011383_05000 [Hymenobacter cavernae]
MPNEFHSDIPQSVVLEVQQALNTIKAALAPYLVSLTPEERKTMLRMADKTVAFVQKTNDYATSNPAFVPPFVDLAELKQDVAALTALTPLHQQLEQLALDVDSTMMTAGSEAYGNSLTIYNNIKFLAQNKQPGAQTAFEDLKQRFAGQGKVKADPAKASAN